jgi:hypothetical protein
MGMAVIYQLHGFLFYTFCLSTQYHKSFHQYISNLPHEELAVNVTFVAWP